MTDTVNQTIREFIAANGLTMACKATDNNPLMDESRDTMDHWKCTLKADKARMTVTFSMGSGHHGKEPQLAEVLDCLASDAAGIENASDFESWAGDYGYESDSRKAEKTFKACEHQASRLLSFLGHDAYDALLWHTDRD